MERDFEEHRGFVDRVADLIGGFSGSMSFVMLHVVWFTTWFLVNTGVLPLVPKFDPYPFILLAMIVSTEGVLLSTFVLMKQNRMQRRSDTRDHVNLQIDLLAEEGDLEVPADAAGDLPEAGDPGVGVWGGAG